MNTDNLKLKGKTLIKNDKGQFSLVNKKKENNTYFGEKDKKKINKLKKKLKKWFTFLMNKYII